MRLIDADDLLTAFPAWENEIFHTSAVRGTINACPTVDAVTVVRCGECQYWDSFPSCSATPQYHACRRRIMGNVHTMREDFCSRGERMGGDHHEG